MNNKLFRLFHIQGSQKVGFISIIKQNKELWSQWLDQGLKNLRSLVCCLIWGSGSLIVLHVHMEAPTQVTFEKIICYDSLLLTRMYFSFARMTLRFVSRFYSFFRCQQLVFDWFSALRNSSQDLGIYFERAGKFEFQNYILN